MPWKKLELLGSGGFSSVHLAVGEGKNARFNDSSTVAVKSAKDTIRSAMNALLSEKDMLQQLRDCPYIIRALGYDTSLENGILVHNLILEYANFGCLIDLIRKYPGRRMPESIVALYSYMILKGLDSIHDRDIIHCDIKPENILAFDVLSQSGGLDFGSDIKFLKIADFGCSKQENACDFRPMTFTASFASPELLKERLQGKHNDIWAFGITVLNMIAGRILDAESLFSKSHAEILEILGYVSEEGIDFLKKCLEKDHRRRWNAISLLNHPFITENLKLSGMETCLRRREQAEAEKGFNMTWKNTRNLFSESSSKGGSIFFCCGKILKMFFKLCFTVKMD